MKVNATPKRVSSKSGPSGLTKIRRLAFLVQMGGLRAMSIKIESQRVSDGREGMAIKHKVSVMDDVIVNLVDGDS